MGAYQRLGQRLGKTRGFAALMKHVAPPVDRLFGRLTGGKRTLAGTVLPTLLLHYKGRKTGRDLTTPISFIRLDNGFAVPGSNFGQRHHPAWSLNLMANPAAQVTIDGEKIPVRARLLSDDEKAALWPRFVEMWPAYNTYAERSGRNIRVFALERS